MKTLDLRGLICPLPVLRANKAMRELAAGDEMRVLADDPAAPADFRAYCETTGHRLVEIVDNDNAFAIVIAKKA
ncbi:MAG: sulfurtransferase TusA family protein [Defluviicoccus sp.]|nr:sulfurtransferase TusA family protein [Defluviicoccus sp.]MDG4593291.1 sulfurtransferase TusA family protein [Defluviicoccus sp.]MDS4011491.1 sulfurtransferase TusA family protein [Defluviicoccus sp.]MDS4072231.1 sulfurtransferase TusA family protein [Defluviicoccus sp.]